MSDNQKGSGTSADGNQKNDKERAQDEKFMRAAIKEAHKAAQKNEIPVGAVVVFEGRIVARGHNLRTKDHDPTAHAEVVAIRKAGKKLGRWNLSGCDLYVTLEPCAMCAGSIVNARIRRLVFGAYDMRFGCCGTLINIAAFEKLNHRSVVDGGILQEECSRILTDHFRLLRKKNAEGNAEKNWGEMGKQKD